MRIFYFTEIKVTTKTWSYFYQKHLLFGRKTMTNLDSMLKSRDITLLTNVGIVKAMVFPVVMYEFMYWTIKKAEPAESVTLNRGVGEDS